MTLTQALAKLAAGGRVGRYDLTPAGWAAWGYLTRDFFSVENLVDPDLENPMVLGCLLALVREASGDDGAHCEPHWPGSDHPEGQAGWKVWANGESSRWWEEVAPTEGEALAAALVALAGSP